MLGAYQSDSVDNGASFKALHDFLDALRRVRQLPPLTFYELAASSVPPEPPAAPPAPPPLPAPPALPPVPATVLPPVPEAPASVAPVAATEPPPVPQPPQSPASTPAVPEPAPAQTDANSSGREASNTLDELDDLDSFLKNSEGPDAELDDDASTAEEGTTWRRNSAVGSSSGQMFGSANGDGDDAQLSAVQSDNRRLKQRVTDLAARLLKRDQELAVANHKVTKLLALLPEGTEVGTDDLTFPPPGSSAGATANKAPAAPESAKDLLLSKLGEFGFETFNVEHVLTDIEGSNGRDHETTVNEVLDRLLTGGDLPSNGSNGDAGAAPAGGAQGLEPLGLGGGLEHQSSFLGRQTSLTRRGGSALSSAASFGLFGDDDDANDEKNGAGRSGDAPGGQAELFGKVAAVSAEPRSVGADKSALEGAAVTYNDFLAWLMRPESNDLVHHMKLYIGSILGPNGDGTAPSKQQVSTLPYRFYGTHMLQRRCIDFFEAMERAMAKHAAWKELGDAGLAAVRNHTEKYVMGKIADLAILGERDEAQDATLSRRMAVLSFLKPEALEVNPNLRDNEVVWTIAQDELRKMAQFKAPGDKIACVVKCCQVIFSVLNLKRGSDDTSRPGADDFLPIFIYVVLKSQVPNLYTNCEYIQNYHNPAALMSKAGYCFVNLRSAVEFILTLDASVLSMDPDDFNSQLAAAEARYEAEHPK